jgi:hypothetical protein
MGRAASGARRVSAFACLHYSARTTRECRHARNGAVCEGTATQLLWTEAVAQTLGAWARAGGVVIGLPIVSEG